MTEIDFMTCTMGDVIARSVLMHPSLYADALAEVAKIHMRARDTMTGDCEARRVAEKMSKTSWDLFCQVRDGCLDIEALDLAARIIAFSSAAKLQCLHYNLAHSIADREDAARKQAA